jgi:hypothetical protein
MTNCRGLAARTRAVPTGEKSLVIPTNLRTEHHRLEARFAKPLLRGTERHGEAPRKPQVVSHTIFEGTSEIQQLVIARAISGLRIE